MHSKPSAKPEKVASPTNTPRRRQATRRRRWLLYVGLGAVLLLVLLQVAFYFFATPLLRQRVQEAVVQKSQGVYALDFDQIKVNLSTRSVYVTNVRLEADTAVYYALPPEDRPAVLYAASFAELEIARVALWRAYRQRQLRVKEIRVTRPAVRVVGGMESVNTDYQEDFLGDLYTQFSGQLRSLEVERLRLVDGNFGLFSHGTDARRLSVADEISVVLHGFRLDSASLYDNDRLFFSDDIEFGLQNFRLALRDSIHELHAEAVRIAKRDGWVVVKGLGLTPNTDKPTTGMRYTVRVPEFRMQIEDLNEAYFSRKVGVRKVLWRSPSVQVVGNQRDASLAPDTLYADLYPLLSDVIDSVAIDTFAIEAGRLSWRRTAQDTALTLQVDTFSFAAERFQLDSSSYRNRDKIFYADRLQLGLRGVTLRLSDSLHVLRAATLLADTRTGTASASGVRIRPLSRSRRAEDRFRVTVPAVQLADIDFPALYHDSRLLLRMLSVDRATVGFTRYRQPVAYQGNTDLYALLSDYLDEVAIDRVRLQRGALQLSRYRGARRDTLSAGDIAFDLYRFRLGTTARSWRVFYADDFDFSFEDYVLKLSDNVHLLTADRVGISTRRREVLASGIRIRPANETRLRARLRDRQRTSTFEVAIPEVRMRGADIARAYFQRQVSVRDIDILRPSASLTHYAGLEGEKRERRERLEKGDLYELIADYCRSVDIDSVRLTEGALRLDVSRNRRQRTLFSNTVSAAMDSFHLDEDAHRREDRIFYAKAIEVSVRDYALNLPDSVHRLTAGEATFSTARSEILLADVALAPIADALPLQRPARTYHVRVPNIQMMGVDMEAFYYQKALVVDQVNVLRPRTEIRRQSAAPRPDRKRRQARPADPTRMPDELKMVQLRAIQLNRGQLFLSRQRGARIDTFVRAGVRLDGDQFLLDENNLTTNLGNLYSEDFAVELTDFYWKLPDSLHTLRAASLRLAAVASRVEAEALRLVPRPGAVAAAASGRQHPVLISLTAPRVMALGLRLGEAIEQRRLVISNLTLQQPALRVDNYARADAKGVTVPNDPYQIIERTLQSLSVGEANLVGGSFAYRRPPQPPLRVDRISGIIEGFRLDANSRDDTRPFYADDVQVQVREGSWQLGDSLNSVAATEIGISTAQRKLWATRPRLTPRYGKEAYARQVGRQVERTACEAQQVRVEGFDFGALLRGGDVRGDALFVEDFRFESYRDKRLPEMNAYRPLPRELLARFPRRLHFEKVYLQNSFFAYEEFAARGRTPGRFTLHEVEAEMSNLTNDPAVWAQHPTLTLDLTGKIMNTGELQASLRIPLDQPAQVFTLRGSLRNMPLTTINPMLEPVAFAVIESGYAEQLDFSLRGNRHVARGEMRFRYQDLKISLADRRTGETDRIGLELASFFANTFVLRSDNPRLSFGPLRAGEVYFERNPSKSFLNYYWKALLSGIKTSIGMSAPKEKDRKYPEG